MLRASASAPYDLFHGKAGKKLTSEAGIIDGVYTPSPVVRGSGDTAQILRGSLPRFFVGHCPDSSWVTAQILRGSLPRFFVGHCPDSSVFSDPKSLVACLVYFDPTPSLTLLGGVYFDPTPSLTLLGGVYFDPTPSLTLLGGVYFDPTPSLTLLGGVYFVPTPSLPKPYDLFHGKVGKKLTSEVGTVDGVYTPSPPSSSWVRGSIYYFIDDVRGGST